MGGFSTAVADQPDMLALWDQDANGDVQPDSIGSRSSRRRWWRCPVAEDHRWVAAPASIAGSLEKGFTGCPCCAGRQLSKTNTFAARYPDGIRLWHPDRNGTLAPHQVLGGSPHPVWWRCPEGPDHEWQAAPLALGKQSLAKGNSGCPFCSGMRPSVTNSVASNPQLLAEWHPGANGDLRPEAVVAGTATKLTWQCLEHPDHVWCATGASRVRGSGCPMCVKHLRSVLEVCLAYELEEFLPGFDLDVDKVLIDGVIRHVDLLLPDLRVVIEVDGRFWHGGEDDHERDARKTALLVAAGYRVLRLREAPLRPVSPHDAQLPTDATVKQTTDAVLSRLLELDWVPLDADRVAAYLAAPEPLHVDEALDRLRTERPGRSIRLPGPVSFTRHERWEDGLAVLRSFVARSGHANVPFEHVETGFALGKWVGAKRAQHRRGRMTAARAHTLAGLPGWVWDAVEDQWEAGYRSLLRFQAEHGHVGVPAHHWDEDGFPLGSWVRSHRRRGGRRTITAEQQRRLEAVPGWTFTAPTQAAWEAAAAALEAFAAREGHCRTPQQYRERGINIDSWAAQQRSKYHSGTLSRQRVQRLEALPGWSWRPKEDAWEAGFTALTEHIRNTGSAAVRRDATVNGYPLGAWVGEQRNRHTTGQLPSDRQRHLERLPGWSWSPLDDSWERHFDALLAFVAREGHACVPTHHTEADLPLASWVHRHRQEYKACKVPAERVGRLEALPGWTWDVRSARWEEHLAALESFAARHGHARVPSDHVEGRLRLGSWVIAQRQTHKKGELSAERATRLSALPGWAWDARDAAWEAGFTALASFHARTGHCLVPGNWLEDGYRLGQWVAVQRGLLRAGGLTAARQARLRELPGFAPAVSVSFGRMHR